MAIRRALPSPPTMGPPLQPVPSFEETLALRRKRYAAGGAAARFQQLDPRFSQPGPFHIYQVGESPGSKQGLASVNVPKYTVQMIRDYHQLSTYEQLRVRYAVAQKESWTRAELEAYRKAVYDSSPANQQFILDPRFASKTWQHVYQVGETPGAFDQDVSKNVPPYTVQMIRNYSKLSPVEQLRVRWAVALKASWTAAELRAYRIAMYEDDPATSQFVLDPRSAESGPFHNYQIGEMTGAFTYPEFPHGFASVADAARQIQRLKAAMEAVEAQAKRGAEAMRKMTRQLPRLTGDPSLDGSTLTERIVSKGAI